MKVMRKAWWAGTLHIRFLRLHASIFLCVCMQGVINGIVTGLGIVKKVKYVTMISYWVYGIPLSYYCMHKLDMGIEGLWFGPSLAVFLNYIIYERAIA